MLMGMNDLSSIFELVSIREQKSTLTKKESEIMKPMLTDMGIIPLIFNWLCEITGVSGIPERRKGVELRQKFIFIILFLYSPSALAGGKMRIGLRDKITEVVGGTGTLISHSYSNLMFRYRVYKRFREEMDFICQSIIGKLKDEAVFDFSQSRDCEKIPYQTDGIRK